MNHYRLTPHWAVYTHTKLLSVLPPLSHVICPMLWRGRFSYFSILQIRELRLRTDNVSPTRAGEMDPNEVFLLKNLPEPLLCPHGSTHTSRLGPFTIAACPGYMSSSSPRLSPTPGPFPILPPALSPVLTQASGSAHPTLKRTSPPSPTALKSTPRNLPLLRMYCIFACASS